MSLPPTEGLLQISKDAALFYTRAWIMGTSGNFSCRGKTEATYWVTASGVDKGALTPHDFMALTTDLTPVDPLDSRQPSDEALIHERIYQQFPTAQVIYHVHPPVGTWLSRQVKDVDSGVFDLALPQIEMLKGLGFKTHESEAHLVMIPNSQDIPALCQGLTPYWNRLSVPAFFIQGHGLYVWGQTPADAKRYVEILDFLCQQLMWDLLYTGKG
jgi:methylthioribulose-1-phosphate dehydratase